MLSYGPILLCFFLAKVSAESDDLSDIYHKRKIKKVTPLWAAKPEVWDEPRFRGYNYGPVQGSAPWNYGKPQENENAQHPNGYHPQQETGVTQAPQQTLIFQRPRPSKPNQPPNNQLKPGYPQSSWAEKPLPGMPSQEPTTVGLQPGPLTPGYPTRPEAQKPQPDKLPRPGYPLQPTVVEPHPTGPPQPGYPSQPGVQQPQPGSPIQPGYPPRPESPSLPGTPQIQSQNPRPLPGQPMLPQTGYPQRPGPQTPAFQRPLPGTPGLFPESVGTQQPQPGNRPTFPQVITIEKPSYPQQPHPGYPQQPQQPQPGFPQLPGTQQPQPSYPQPGYPQQPQPGYPQRPGSQKPFQPGSPQQPGSQRPQQPLPDFSQQPGYPQQPGPQGSQQPHPGYPQQPAFPQQPQPDSPQLPESQRPLQPQPGYPQQSGFPQQPQPGSPQLPGSQRPPQSQPSYPQRPPDNEIYPGHPFYPQIQPPLGPGELPGLNTTATEELRKYCKAPRGQFGTNRSCSSFVNCWDDMIVEQECGGNLLFNEDKKYCDYPDNVDCMGRPITKPFTPSDGNCQSPFGSFRSTTNCAEFFVCVHGVANRFICPGGTAYNSDLGICDYPYRVDCNGIPLLPAEVPNEVDYQSLYQSYANENQRFLGSENLDENKLPDSIVVDAA